MEHRSRANKRQYCKAGHPLTGANVGWVYGGKGALYARCRICNAAAAKAWRAANAHRLVYPPGGTKGGKVLARAEP